MGYDQFAPFYKTVETLVYGKALQQARCAGLSAASPESVLVVGDGNGRFLEQAIRAWPDAHFVSVDASEGMLREAKRRVTAPQVKFIHADIFDALHGIEGQTFDVIVTHFFMDCFREDTLERLIPKLLGHLSIAGTWCISDFTNQKFYHRAMLWVMYRFFHTFTETPAQRLPDYRKILVENGLVPENLGSWRLGFIIAELWHQKA